MNRGWKQVMVDGLICGVIGYLIVVVLIAVFDLVQGRAAFHTAAVLGSTLFYGLRDPALLVIWPGPVLAYNGAHLAVFFLLGIFLAWLASLAERGASMWYVALVIFLIVVPHVLGFPIWFQPSIRQTISLWTVVVATLAAAVGMAAYLWRAHPRLRRRAMEDAG